MASTSETGLQLFARLIPRPSLIGIDEALFPEGPNPKDVIELSGEPSCGKTLLFTHFIVKCILPKDFKNIPIRGLKASVVLLNTDHHFQMYKLISVLENHLQAVKSFSVSEVEEVVKDSLSRLIVYNVSDSVQLQVTFHALQVVVANQPEIGLILIDGVSAFYWQDTMMNGIRKIDLYVKTMIKNLQKILGDYKGVIMYTRPAYFQSKGVKTDSHSLRVNSLSSVNCRILLRQTDQVGEFCAEVETASHRLIKTFTINSSGIQWL